MPDNIIPAVTSPLLSVVKNGVYVVFKHPAVLFRGGNPAIWALRRARAEWKYDSLSTTGPRFVADITGVQLSTVNGVFDDLKKYRDSTSCAQWPILYALMKLFQPATVVETGVAEGHSSSAILHALRDAGKHGQLYSLELPPGQEKLEDGAINSPKEKGYRVPQELRKNWHLILGDARETLPPLLAKLGTIDVFVHDSLHTESHMMWEYRAAWPHIRKNGILISHDISVSFWQFARKQRVSMDVTDIGSIRSRYGAVTKP